MIRHARILILVLLTLTWVGCNPPRPDTNPVVEGEPADPEEEVDAGGVKLEPANSPPQFELPQWETVGVGQSIGIGVNVIDPEADVISVEAVNMPASATYDPLTLTFSFTPTEADKPQAFFQVAITETRRETGKTVRYLHDFGIRVVDETQPRPHARPLDPVTELLITVHDPERLAALNARWPFKKVLVRAAEIELQYNVSNADTVNAPTLDILYTSFLKELATFHDNPRLDPESPEFDKAAFGNPDDWELIAFRPRLDKAWHELRLVYRSTASPEIILPMFRFRPVKSGSDTTPTEQARAWNNTEFQRMIFASLFVESGELNPAFIKDKAAHGEALAGFLDTLLSYDTSADNFAESHVHFLVLAHEGRLGGGTVRDASGKYVSGDGWAFGGQRPRRIPPDNEMRMVATPLLGFVTAAEPSDDGKSWKRVCATRYNPDNPEHEPGYEVLCRGEGFVALPVATDDGKITDGNLDAAHLYLEHKEVHSVADLPLRDPRRDTFEEKGMTCSQCHVRNFGVRDMTDPAATDPSAGLPRRENPTVDTTFFVITPLGRWYPYTVQFQKLQACKARDNFKTFLGKDVAIDCPLNANP